MIALLQALVFGGIVIAVATPRNSSLSRSRMTTKQRVLLVFVLVGLFYLLGQSEGAWIGINDPSLEK